MPRYLLLHLPAFRLERCGWTADQRVLLADNEKNALRVQARTPAAQAAGVRPGMTVAEARAICPDVQIELRRAEEEQADLNELCGQMLLISPNIAPLEPESLVAEISRSAALFAQPDEDAEAVVLERMVRRLRDLGHVARGVISDDPATALACAAWGEQDRIIAPGEGAAALAPLPLAALHLPWSEHDLLIGLGIETIHAFARLDPAALAGRVGPVSLAAHALARGRGTTPTLPPVTPSELLMLEQDLPDPVDNIEAMLFVVNALLMDGAVLLATAGRAATRITLLLRLDGGPEQHISLRLGAPTRSPERILRLLRLQLQNFTLPGPVISICTEFTNTVCFDGRQSSLLGRHRVDDALSDVIARLQDGLGCGAVSWPRLVDSHMPEAGWVAQALDPADVPEPVRHAPGSCPLSSLEPRHPDVMHGIAEDPASEWEGWPAPEVPRRPALMLLASRPLDVRAGGWGLPQALHLDGRWVSVVGMRGPERRQGQWWLDGDGGDFDREYWTTVLKDGRKAWLYRESGHWLLQGWWDGAAAR